ncbi:MAG: MarC family protein [Betaproteobacteria bacterium]
MTAELRHLLEGLLLVIGALLPIVNPLGTAPVFLALTSNVDDATRSILARKVAINGFFLLMASIFIGGFVLEFFGLSIPVVQIAGGLVVCSLAWGLLREGEISVDASTAVAANADSIETRAFYPLTLPLTVGPGSISVAITLGANHPSTARSFLAGALTSIVGVVLVCLSIYACYRYSKRLGSWLGRSGTQVVLRLSAFILLCIGVQIIWNGADALLGITVPARAQGG